MTLTFEEAENVVNFALSEHDKWAIGMFLATFAAVITVICLFKFPLFAALYVPISGMITIGLLTGQS